MNFGTILNSMTRNCISLMVENRNDEAREATKSFISYVNSKDILKRQFHVYHNLNNSYMRDKEKARTFVIETLGILDRFRFKDIKVYNALLETKFSVPKAKSTDMDSDIGTLIRHWTSEDQYDQATYVEALSNVITRVSTIRETTNPVDTLNDKMSHSTLRFLKPKHVVRLGINKFNKTYGKEMTSEDRAVFTILQSKDQARIKRLHETTVGNLKKLSKSVSKDMNEQLAVKLASAIGRIEESATADGILNGYELLIELRSLQGAK